MSEHNPSAGQAPSSDSTIAKPGPQRRVEAAFIAALADDFASHGSQVIGRCREESPATYLRVIASLMPTAIEVDKPLCGLSDDELTAALAAVQTLIDGERKAVGPEGSDR